MSPMRTEPCRESEVRPPSTRLGALLMFGECLILLGVNLAVGCADNPAIVSPSFSWRSWFRYGHSLHFKGAPQREAGAFRVLAGEVAKDRPKSFSANGVRATASFVSPRTYLEAR